MGSLLRIVLLVVTGGALLLASRFLTSYDRGSLVDLENALGVSLLFLAFLLAVIKTGTPTPAAKKAEPPPATEAPPDKPAA